METGGQIREEAKTTIFVSYSRADRKRALPVIKILTDAGYNVWWDGLLEGGERFANTTNSALEAAKAVIVLWSQSSVVSHWVHDEATRARDRQCLVPLSLDGSAPPLGFGQFQVIDIARAKIRADAPEMQSMLRAVAALHGTDAPTDSTRERGPFRPGRREAIGAGIVVALAGGGFAAREWIFSNTAADARSIAVLPFDNLSGDTSKAYFSDGLSEELRSTLSLNRQILVAAQTSSNSFRGDNLDAKTIAAKLDVAYILDGSVRQSGDLVRISAQLIDGASGFEKWSQSFDRNLSDIFAVQSDIATTVADALAARIGSKEESSKQSVGGTKNTDAYDAYLRGKALYALAESEQTDRAALASFSKAIAADSRYASAYAAKSRALTVIANNYVSGDAIRDHYRQSIDAARTAIRLAPDLAEGYSALGFVLFNGMLDVKAAGRPYEQSFERGFGNADILASYANYAARTGKFDDARKAVERAKRLDPLNASVFRNAAIVEYCDRKYDAAVPLLENALSLNPKIGGVQSVLGDIALLRGQPDQAKAYFAKEPVKLAAQKGLAIAALKMDQAAEGQSILDRMIAEFGNNSLYQQAQIMAQSGRVEDAISCLEKARAAGDSGLVLLHNDPLLDPLRSVARFKAISTAMGFT